MRTLQQIEANQEIFFNNYLNRLKAGVEDQQFDGLGLALGGHQPEVDDLLRTVDAWLRGNLDL